MTNLARALSLALAGLTLSTLAACGGDDDDLTAGGFIDQFTTAFCTKGHECKSTFPNDLGLTHDQIFGADVASCKAMFVTKAQVDAATEAGHIVFNASAGGTCLSKVNALDCAGFWNGLSNNTLPAECDTAVAGNVQSGDSCTINLECASQTCNAEICSE